MKSQAGDFPARAKRALLDENLRIALERAKVGFVENRRQAFEQLPEELEIREQAREIKDHTLAHLDYYLEQFEANVTSNGGHVHWASTPKEACDIVLNICRQVEAKRVIKGKSMISEEIGLNDVLIAADLDVVETDLGEYIIQLAGEPPSHIIAPAVHKTRQQITELFHTHHQKYGLTEPVTEITDIVNEARTVLRQAFLSADVGITGANFLVAETGSSMIVTNEGNGDLSNTLPSVHVVTASIEKVVPSLEDAGTLLRLLARSATGQDMSCYTTLSSGPRRSADLDGPAQYHVVIVDNGRSAMLGGEFKEMLRCIRCGACLNHCPVYGAVGGHAYGWVYSGPMGAVLTPLIVGLDGTKHLPNACTLNGRCAQMCPMSIPLPALLRKLRVREYERHLLSSRARGALSVWAFLARRPRLYHAVMGLGIKLLSFLGGKRGCFQHLPLASGWTDSRDLPAPQGQTFQSAWANREKQ